ncbi:MAG: hypothetical protein GX493_11555, partial [Firmicutes bacterium]|nr:hypothetical protein [Bacillota bacterium]
MFDLGLHESKVLSLAGLMAAGACGALAFSLMPGVFEPWPAAWPIFFLAGLTGALSFWAARGRISGLPLSLLFLPPLRLFLFWWQKAAFDWPPDYRFLLLGNDFPWWAGASLVASFYAGKFTVSWVKISAVLARVRADHIGCAEEAARLHTTTEETKQVFFTTLLFESLCFSFFTKRDEAFPTAFCLAVFLLAGAFLLGFIRARSLLASAEAEKALVDEVWEKGWWRGHRTWIWCGIISL